MEADSLNSDLITLKAGHRALEHLAFARFRESRKYKSDVPSPNPPTRQMHDTCAACKEFNILANT